MILIKFYIIYIINIYEHEHFFLKSCQVSSALALAFLIINVINKTLLEIRSEIVRLAHDS